MRDERLRQPVPRVRANGVPRPTRELAELKALAVLAEIRPTRLPIDVDDAARAAGIELVEYATLGGQSAILSVVAGIPAVLVERSHARVRQRFSIAHEVGHWVLERAPISHDLRPIASRGRAYTELERICDYFAASLLMPRIWMQERVAIGMTSGELAKAFEVSESAMSARMRELGLVTQRGRLR